MSATMKIILTIPVWLLNGFLLLQTSINFDSLLTTFTTILAFGLTSVLVGASYYWYKESKDSIERRLEAEEELKRLKESLNYVTLTNFKVSANKSLAYAISEHMSTDEIQNMKWDIGIDVEWTDVMTKDRFVRRIISHLEDRKQVYKIKEWLMINRPDISFVGDDLRG